MLRAHHHRLAVAGTPLASGDDARRTLCNGGVIAGRDGVLAVEGFATAAGAAWLAGEAERLAGMRPTHVVLTHYHGDHTTGLEVLIAANPTVPIYVPQEGAFFRGPAPKEFFTRDASVPGNMRYFDGKDPGQVRSGTPWRGANFQIVTRTTEILPGFFVLTTRSDKLGTREMNEVSLAIRTPQGLAVVVGCSHPGVEKILDAAAQIDKQLYTTIGGFHLVLTPREEIERALMSAVDFSRSEEDLLFAASYSYGLQVNSSTLGEWIQLLPYVLTLLVMAFFWGHRPGPAEEGRGIPEPDQR